MQYGKQIIVVRKMPSFEPCLLLFLVNDHFTKIGLGQNKTQEKLRTQKSCFSAGVREGGAPRGKNTHILRHLILKTIILPRQARDKHIWGNLTKRRVPAGLFRPRQGKGKVQGHGMGGAKNAFLV